MPGSYAEVDRMKGRERGGLINLASIEPAVGSRLVFSLFFHQSGNEMLGFG